MAGTLTISTLSDGTNSTSSTNCIQGSAKAWVSFSESGSGASILASYNVSSVTRTGTGLHTIAFTNSLPDANYAIGGFARNTGGTERLSVCQTSAANAMSSSSFQIVTGGSGSIYDVPASVAVFR